MAGVIVGAAALAAGLQSATAQTTVGVHFGNAGGTGYATNTSTDLLLPTDSAGIPGYAQTNWNNLGAQGDSVGFMGTPVVLTNSAGAATSLSIEWASTLVGSTGTAAGLGTPDGKLMDGYLYTYGPGLATPLTSGAVYYNPANDNPLAYVGGLNAWCQAQGAVGYKVVLYTSGYSSYEYFEGYLESVTGSPFSFTMVEGSVLTPPLYGRENASFSGTYAPITGTSSNSPSYNANYMVFAGLTNDAILIRLQCIADFGAGLNGFQIIPVFATGASVGVHFVSAGGPSVQNSSPDSISPTASAGAPGYAQTNWNNLGAAGDSYGNWGWATWINNGSGPGAPVVLNDSIGSPTSLQITWGSSGYGSTGAAAALGTPDGDLMDGFINTYAGGPASFMTNNGPAYFAPNANQTPLATISGLNSWVAGYPGAVGYNVVLYFSEVAGTYSPTVEGYVNATTGDVVSGNGTLTEVATLTPPVFGQATGTFAGTYVQATSTNSSSPTVGANYMVLTGLTNDSIVIHAVMYGYQEALNGFQIVPVLGSTPVVTLVSTVSGSSLTLSWPQGTLQTATNLLGPWMSSPATSPFTDTMTNAMEFYRVKVQ